MRRVEVPLDIRLDDLHFVLQIAIGWQNCHPFEFRLDGETTPTWGLVDRDDPESSPLPAERATLADLLAHGQHTFHYDYVYGEDWAAHHRTGSSRAGRPSRALSAPYRGQGRCPPADIGGVTGYETFLRAISDPLHLNHEGIREWDDPDFDPHVVDEAALRANLANLGKYLGRRKPAG